MKKLNINDIKNALKNNINVTYCNKKIIEVKGNKCKTEDINYFFTPWGPAIKIED